MENEEKQERLQASSPRYVRVEKRTNGEQRSRRPRISNHQRHDEVQKNQEHEINLPYRQYDYANNSKNNSGYRPRRQYDYANDGENNGGYRPRKQYDYANDGENDGGYRPRRQYDYANDGENNGGYRPRRHYDYANDGENNGGYRPRRHYDYANDGENNGGYRPRRQYNYVNDGENSNGYRPRKQYNTGNKPYKKPSPFKKRVEYRDTNDPDAEIRLNKFLANAGICSRREADQYIQAGVVSVNGQVITELGTKVKRSDEVKFHEQPVSIEKKVYVLLNKPKDYVTTSDDPQKRKTVMDLVRNACKERIYPVGRLDRNTTGVLLLTNDGEMASKLTHPKFLKKKVYQARLDKNITKHDMEQLITGIQLEDGEIHADQIEYAQPNAKNVVGIEIHSGRNRIVRRMFEAVGYRVVQLDRTMFAGLTKKNVRRGDWRYLTEKEVDILRAGAYE